MDRNRLEAFSDGVFAIIISIHGRSSKLASAIGRDWKGKLSPAGYVLAIAFSFLLPLVSACLYFCVAFVWLVPDRRIERFVGEVSRQMESGNNRG